MRRLTVNAHAIENFTKYAKRIRKETMLALLAKMRQGLKMNCSVACVVNLDTPISNPHRDDWQMNNRIVAIIRNKTVITVMLSRRSQITKAHLRTERCI